MPPKKKAQKGPRGMGKAIPSGITMEDLTKKMWQLGPVIGQGGFGYIYLGGPTGGTITEGNATYVIKVEPHENGPLFVELAFYQRVAKREMISSWLKEKKRKNVGMPLYIATGSFEHTGVKYRFMVMERFGTDIEKIYKENDFQFPEETVYSLGLRIIDTLEYIHSKEYVHADIKSSNVMLGFAKVSQKQAYLLDYGLAYRYAPAGKHVPYKEDPKRRHDGTIEYTSRDAHKGCAPSRRGDLEILAYCMLQWLCKKLPWEKNLENKDYVMNEKIKYMNNVGTLMKECFPSGNVPVQLEDYIQYVTQLKYDETPDYNRVCSFFTTGLKNAGFKDDGTSVVLPSSKASTKKRDTSGSTGSLRSPRKRAKKTEPEIQEETFEVEEEEVLPIRGKGVVKSSSRAKRKASTRQCVDVKSKVSHVKTVPSTSSEISKGRSASDDQIVHKRVRKRNVPTRDFGQSP